MIRYSPTSSQLELWRKARTAACLAAAEAWSQIEPLYVSGSHVENKKEGPTTEADRLADRLIAQRLQQEFPLSRFAYLTEETDDNLKRLEFERVWVIDPIDGTMDFIKKNGQFTIHVALVERLGDGYWHAVASAVYRPIGGEMYSAVRGEGSHVEEYAAGEPTGRVNKVRVSERSKISEMKAVMSASHRTPELNQLMSRMGFAEILSVGSIGIKLAVIANGQYDCYINLARNRSREWDSCAPHLILEESGGILTGLGGEALTYNNRSVYHADGLIGSNGKIHDEICARVAALESEIVK
jgi:3'(2'), 5'-bisphosphate nucleotidase